MAIDLSGKVAVVTGGAQGIGEALCQRLAGAGANVVVGDVNEDLGNKVAHEIGGLFVRCDVTDLADSAALVRAAVDNYGGVDIVLLNAGVMSSCGLGDDFDVDTYRRAMAINLDGVVYGAHAALPALRARGGGDIIMTASLAGLTVVPLDPIYAANKAAVVALARALGTAHEPEGIRVNAVCPAFTNTSMVDDIRESLDGMGVPLIETDQVVDTFLTVLEQNRSAEAWFVQPGRSSEPFRFNRAPGPRRADGQPAEAVDAARQVKIRKTVIDQKV